MSDTKKCSDILQYIENIQENIDKLEKELGNIDISLNAKDIPVETISGLDASNVQQALSKLFQSADSARKTIGATIGYPVSTSDSFDTMNNKLVELKKDLSNAIISKGASINPTSSLDLMVAAVNRIKSTDYLFRYGTARRGFQGTTVGFKPSFVLVVMAHDSTGSGCGAMCSDWGSSSSNTGPNNSCLRVTDSGFEWDNFFSYERYWWFAVE